MNDDPGEVAEWRKQLGLEEDDGPDVKLAVVITLAIIAACVAIAMLAVFAGLVAMALARDYEIDAELDLEKKTIHFVFTKRPGLDLPF